MRDRAMQALYLLALDPIAETTADHASYGFRQARSCADAIERCFACLHVRTLFGYWRATSRVCWSALHTTPGLLIAVQRDPGES